MFRIASEATYVSSVKGELAGGEAFEFQATFRRLTRAELQALNDRVTAGDAGDEDVIGRVLVGWSDVVDDSGASIEFNPQNLFRVLNEVGVQQAIVQAFYESLPGARRKN